jgi:hypothetical protein
VDGLDDDEGGGMESKILAIRDFLEDPDQVPSKIPIFTRFGSVGVRFCYYC